MFEKKFPTPSGKRDRLATLTMPAPIPDTPENVVRAITKAPQKRIGDTSRSTASIRPLKRPFG